MPESEPYIVVWCDSPLGLISTRVDEQEIPIEYQRAELPDVVQVPTTTTGIFDILKRRDGTKVAVHSMAAYYTFGWNWHGLFS